MTSLLRIITVGATLVFACGSEATNESPSSSSSTGGTSSSGGSSSGGSSSGGGGSSGADGCLAICSSRAILKLTESNAGGRLEGAVIEACLGDRCASGTLAARDGGTGYDLPLVSTSDAGSAAPVRAKVAAAANDDLGFSIEWSFGDGAASAAGLTDGDVYTVKAAKDGEPALFERTWTATYELFTECSSTCKKFEPKP